MSESQNTQNESSTTTTKIVTNGGSGGLFGLLLTIFLGPIGLFLSLWLLGKNLVKGIIYGLIFAVLLLICIAIPVIGWFLVPIVWIVMLIIAYKGSNSPIDLTITTTTK